ncbi:MAG TPA: biotin/lipoyl-binding protein [Candidatus Coprenecus avistercoris]|uniref:Biotin/lipoyl-binding protein n=1 Tax=Candidatus Coprenecus avistercoris TaxID=2840730 RepID=A0A9D1E1E7_9BACT|nr:biotin/lipoyl-binding protein [Candidatus Coprenecus avistercoris]
MKEYKLKINGNDYNVVINDVQESVASIEVNGSNYKVEFEKPIVKPTAIKVVKTATAAPAVSAAAPKPAAAPAPSAGGTTVSSPLPGVILEVCVKEGDTVKNGQKIMVLEAMKMENVVEATADGVIKSIKVNKGDSVMEGTPLAIIG